MSGKTPGDYTIRPATPADVPVLRALITELAVFEHLTHLVTVTDDDLRTALFGSRTYAEAVVLQPRGEPQPVAFALFFHNFSTFLGRPGLYIEDLYVQEAHRGRGYGTALLRHCARIAVERRCGRFEWSVLDWNVAAQRFYEKHGATILPDWRIVRVTGEALERLAREEA